MVFKGKKEKKKKKLFPSVDPKAALLIQNFLFSMLQNKVERAGMQTMPAQWEKLLQTASLQYVQSTL